MLRTSTPTASQGRAHRTPPCATEFCPIFPLSYWRSRSQSRSPTSKPIGEWARYRSVSLKEDSHLSLTKERRSSRSAWAMSFRPIIQHRQRAPRRLRAVLPGGPRRPTAPCPRVEPRPSDQFLPGATEVTRGPACRKHSPVVDGFRALNVNQLTDERGSPVDTLPEGSRAGDWTA